MLRLKIVRNTTIKEVHSVWKNGVKVVITGTLCHRGFTASVRKGNKAMQITDVRVRKVAKEGKLKAIVSITMDEEFVVHDIKVIEGEKGLFIAMPSKKALDGEYRDIAHPINSGTRDRIQTIILERYQNALEETE